MELNPGTELILSDHPIQSVAALANDGVARREVTPVSFGGKVQGVVNEFSMVSLLGQMQAVKSPETPYEKQLASELIKTAAVVQQVIGPKAGRYAVPTGPSLPMFDGRESADAMPAAPANINGGAPSIHEADSGVDINVSNAGGKVGGAGIGPDTGNAVAPQAQGGTDKPFSIIDPNQNSPVRSLETSDTPSAPSAVAPAVTTPIHSVESGSLPVEPSVASSN
jgi:hypothetical protein